MKRIICLLIAASVCSAGAPETVDQRRGNQRSPLKVGQKAPTFKLEYLNKENKHFDLKESLGKKPVVLVFGSYT